MQLRRSCAQALALASHQESQGDEDVAPPKALSPFRPMGLQKRVHDVPTPLAALVELHQARKIGLTCTELFLGEGRGNPSPVVLVRQVQLI